MGRPIRWSELQTYRQWMEVASNGELRTNCIFCQDDKLHMYVNEAKGVYHCFKCGTSGKILRRKEDKLDLSRYKIQVERFKTQPVVVEKVEVRSMPIAMPAIDSPKATSYLKGRGLTDDEITRNCLQYCHRDYQPEYYDSIIFPIPKTYQSKVDYFTCRTLRPNPHAKYINAPWPKGDAIYIPALQGKYDYITICEGPFDAIRAARLGYSYGLLGKQASKGQLEKLRQYLTALPHRYPIIVMLDPDAYLYALKLTLQLTSMGIPTVTAQLLEKDPGDSSEEELENVCESLTRQWKQSRK